jgi:hypothetical protein
MSDLASYVESGELPPNDPELLAKLFEQATTGNAEEVAIEQDEAGKTASAASGANGAATEATKEGEPKTPEKEPDGILAKDGKHVISYDVLKSERQARQEAQQRLKEMEVELERLKNPVSTQQPSFKTMTEEQIQELKDYFPEQYEAIASQQAAFLASQQRLSQYEQQEQKRLAEEQQRVVLTVQEEIDNNPILSHWQRNSPEIWAECVEMDNRLRANPATANLTMTERFAKVAAAMSQIYETPFKADAEKQQSSTKTAPAPTQQKPIINSLSDIPGGEAPEASERQRLEDSSSAEIGDRFMKMTEDQRNAYLNSLG